MSPDRRPRWEGAAAIYLLPAVVGGGWGDIEEVLAVGRELARRGHRLICLRRPDHPWPRGVDGPWSWPPCERTDHLLPSSLAAITVAPAWSLSADPLGRGVWAEEVAAIEEAHGAERTVHVSLEEFARTLTSRAAERERLREGGVPRRAIRAEALERGARFFHRIYARARGFDRPRVLHLFPGFAPSRAFAREFPSAIETGPIPVDPPSKVPRRSAPSGRSWWWYASPSSAERIAPSVLRGLGDARPPIRLKVVSPRPWSSRPEGVTFLPGPIPRNRWKAGWTDAELRIVTGSRSLLEAIADGRPFLYFNGVRGDGRRRRRHRPEKIEALLRAARAARVAPDLRTDLSDFARGRRVAEVVHRAHRREGGWSPFPSHWGLVRFPPPYGDPAELIDYLARALANGEAAARWVARLRTHAPGRRAARRSLPPLPLSPSGDLDAPVT
jgi:hypothetical protein